MEETKELTPEEKKKQYIREWHAKNRARVQEQQKLYREANKDRIKELKAANYEANKTEILKKQREDRVVERRARNDAIGAYGY